MRIFDFAGPLAPLLRALVLTGLAIGWALILARMVGLRAFSKASAFDFVANVATRRVFGTCSLSWRHSLPGHGVDPDPELPEWLKWLLGALGFLLLAYLFARGGILHLGV